MTNTTSPRALTADDVADLIEAGNPHMCILDASATSPVCPGCVVKHINQECDGPGWCWVCDHIKPIGAA